MRKTFSLLAIVAIVTTTWLAAHAADKPKHTIKEVMKVAHKGGLMKKVADGNASDDEKKQLVELYESLAANKPPKGDDADWKTKTDALLTSAKAADGKTLLKAANCKACHEAHKGG
jgi:cytochrome c553